MAKCDLPWVEMLTGSWSGPLRLRVRGRSMMPTLHPGDEVLTEPVKAAALHPGDWIVVQANGGPFIHRFLGCTPEGQLLTKGDAHRAPDPPWPPEALLGRAVALSRAGETLPVASSSLRERAKTQWHRLLAATWSLGHRAGLLAFLLALLLPLTVGAAVEVYSFEAQPQENLILITWKTGSEVTASGFYVWRALLQEEGTYERLPIGETPDFIGAEGSLIGTTYKYTDTVVTVGVTYYYRLEALEVDGSSELHGPISAVISPPVTSTPTPSPTPTLAPGQPTPTPSPEVHFWADETEFQAGKCTTLHWETTHVTSVYLDGAGVPGSSGKTFCPCSDETHTLRVLYSDGSSEDFSITLTVTGNCTAEPAGTTPSPTPSLTVSAAATPRPTATSRLTATPRPTTARATSTPLPAPTTTLALSSPLPTPRVSPLPELSPAGTPNPSPRRELSGDDPSTPSSGWLLIGIGASGMLFLGCWWFIWQRRRQP